jgi:hypothetical protein
MANSNTTFRELSAFDETLMTSPYIISDYSGNDNYSISNSITSTRPIPIAPSNSPSFYNNNDISHSELALSPPPIIPFSPPYAPLLASSYNNDHLYTLSPPTSQSNSFKNYSRGGSYKLPLISPFRDSTSSSTHSTNTPFDLSNSEHLHQEIFTSNSYIKQSLEGVSSSAPKYSSHFLDQVKYIVICMINIIRIPLLQKQPILYQILNPKSVCLCQAALCRRH